MKYSKTQPTFHLSWLEPKKPEDDIFQCTITANGTFVRRSDTVAVRGDALLRVAELIDSGVTTQVVLETQEVFEKEK